MVQKVVFTALTSASFGLYKSLWVTDGTGAGSVDITPDAANSAFAPNMLGHVGNYTIFQADDVAFDPSSFSLVGSHYGLWTTDGTAAGTMSMTPSIASSRHLVEASITASTSSNSTRTARGPHGSSRISDGAARTAAGRAPSRSVPH